MSNSTAWVWKDGQPGTSTLEYAIMLTLVALALALTVPNIRME